MAITESERYPVYGIQPVDPEILAEYPDAGAELGDEFITHYRRVWADWEDLQQLLGDMTGGAR